MLELLSCIVYRVFRLIDDLLCDQICRTTLQRVVALLISLCSRSRCDIACASVADFLWSFIVMV